MWQNNEIFKYGARKHVSDNVCCEVEVFAVRRLALSPQSGQAEPLGDACSVNLATWDRIK